MSTNILFVLTVSNMYDYIDKESLNAWHINSEGHKSFPSRFGFSSSDSPSTNEKIFQRSSNKFLIPFHLSELSN